LGLDGLLLVGEPPLGVRRELDGAALAAAGLLAVAGGFLSGGFGGRGGLAASVGIVVVAPTRGHAEHGKRECGEQNQELAAQVLSPFVLPMRVYEAGELRGGTFAGVRRGA